MQDATTYFEKKMAILSDLLGCSEEILSCLNNDTWQQFEDLGQRRESLMHQMQELESSCKEQLNPLLTDEQRKTINDKLNLIMDFDKDVIQKLESEKRETLNKMRENKAQKNVLYGYKMPSIPASGTFFNIKE